METLLEDYKRKLETIETLISYNTNNGSTNDIKRRERLVTKASEYRTFIIEIERAMARQNPEAKATLPIKCVISWAILLIKLDLKHKK